MTMLQRVTAGEETKVVKEAEVSGYIAPALMPTEGSNCETCLHDICLETERVLGGIHNVWFGAQFNLGVELCELPADAFTETLQARLSEAKDSLERLAVAAANGAAVLGAVRENVAQRLEESVKECERLERARSAWVGGSGN